MKIPIVVLALVFLQCTSFSSVKDRTETQRNAAKAAGLPLFVNIGFFVNSASGIETVFSIFNLTNENMKYVRISTTIFNAVGDEIKCSIKGRSNSTFNFTGPLMPFDGTELNDQTQGTINGAMFGPAWYNSTVDCIRVDSVEIDYTNGKREKITEKSKLKLIQSQIQGHDSINMKVKPLECGWK